MDNAAATAQYKDVAQACRVVRRVGGGQMPAGARSINSDPELRVTIALYVPQWQMVIGYLRSDLEIAERLQDNEEISLIRETLDSVTAALAAS